jgi:hypothetical protein
LFWRQSKKSQSFFFWFFFFLFRASSKSSKQARWKNEFEVTRTRDIK